jgi:two-component system, OmpR family, alkaline phosphatase synthesis response regulator PhoP
MATIVIIDDEVNIAASMCRCVEVTGHTSHVAYDGNAGLTMVKDLLPDLVLLDVGLPGMDGLEVCKQIRQAQLPVAPHIIIMTAKAQDRDYLINEIGADDYLPKPYSPQELIQRIRAVLESEPQPA